MPLWVPVAAGACVTVRQSALKTPVPVVYPKADETRAAYGRWLEMQPCEARLLRLAAVADRMSKPKIHDALDVSPGPNAVFDPSHGLLVTGPGFTGYSATICGGNRSVPYGVPYADLDPVKTAFGGRVGMSAARVERLEGPARLIPLDAGFVGIDYRWGGTHALDFLLYRSRVMAIDYSERSR